jgi:hypothetical protein
MKPSRRSSFVAATHCSLESGWRKSLLHVVITTRGEGAVFVGGKRRSNNACSAGPAEGASDVVDEAAMGPTLVSLD